VLTDVLINGEKKDNLNITDRGIQYGDGLFETIEVSSGRAVFIDRHLDRLQLGCKQLHIPYPGNPILLSEIDLLLESASNAVLKIQITRGAGGRGYRQPDSVTPTRILSLHSFPKFPDSFTQEGINVTSCKGRLSSNPVLAGIKHTNRLEQVLARAEWVSESIQEGLMSDQQGNVIEGTMSNVFMVKEEKIITPLLDHCGVAGIIRGLILDFCPELGFVAEQQLVTKECLNDADEIFVTNSVIGVWPVRMIDNHRFSIGPVTRQISAYLEQLKNQEIHA
jgi:4-amino-4-deoxychorismate lyase